jgi:hypothetical protein
MSVNKFIDELETIFETSYEEKDTNEIIQLMSFLKLNKYSSVSFHKFINLCCGLYEIHDHNSHPDDILSALSNSGYILEFTVSNQ